MEGKLGRFLDRFGLADDREERAKLQVRNDETARTIRYSAHRYNLSIDQLSAKRLGQQTGRQISSAINSAVSTQRSLDEIFWKRALLQSGLSLKKVNEICDRKDEIELKADVETPLFDSATQDSTS